MKTSSVGDLALSMQLRRQNADLKANLGQLSQELSSGITTNLSLTLRGDFSALAGLERGISTANSYLLGVSEKSLDSAASQSALEKLNSLGQISVALLTAQETGDQTLVQNAGQDALSRFSAALQTLNTQVGGRSIFAGITPDSPAVADSELIVSALEAEIALVGTTTADAIATIVDDWFEIGGGYDSVGYLGADAATFGSQLSASEISTPQVTAQEGALRDFLAALAKGALIASTALVLAPEEQGKLAKISGQDLVAADAGLIDLQANIGITQAQVERASVEVRAEIQALELAKNELIAVDPYETVVKFENTQTQLETLYNITARLLGLSLANYL